MCFVGADALISPEPYGPYSEQEFGSIWGSTPTERQLRRFAD